MSTEILKQTYCWHLSQVERILLLASWEKTQLYQFLGESCLFVFLFVSLNGRILGGRRVGIQLFEILLHVQARTPQDMEGTLTLIFAKLETT